MRDDLPTLLLPMKANSGCSSLGFCEILSLLPAKTACLINITHSYFPAKVQKQIESHANKSRKVLPSFQQYLLYL